VPIIAIACLGISAAISLLSLAGVIAWRRQRRSPPAAGLLGPVTLLKPLCGDEPDLYANLRSFCLQQYAAYQIVFGVRDASDPAIAVALALTREFPQLDIDIVINAQQHGSNRKISNLINMLERARHEVLVISDSDARVGADYLAQVVAPLLSPRVGLVTCLYRSVPTAGIWSRLGALYVNAWYMPCVLLARLFGHGSYASGQTLCLRAETLRAIGGLRAIANDLADDYRLGEFIRRRGLRIHLSHYLLDTEHHETSFEELLSHETRWMRTLKVLRPMAFRFLFLTFSVPLSAAGMALITIGSPWHTAAIVLLAATVSTRVALACLPPSTRVRPDFASLWLLPARDLLLCWIWCRTFFASRIVWRGGEFEVDARGIMRAVLP